MTIASIIDWSVNRRWLILAFTGVICLWGYVSFLNLPIDAVPDITNVQVQINVTSSGLSPEDLERKVTYPIEIAVSGLPGVLETRSLTKFGLSQVTVIFEDGSDIYRNRQMVNERLQNLRDLPPGTDSPVLSPISTGLGEIYHYTVEINENLDPIQRLMKVREIQEWLIKPRLLTVPGVAEINSIGGLSRQVQVQPDLNKMSRFKVNLTEIRDALRASNRNAGGAYVRERGQQLLIQAVGQFTELDEIRNLPIKSLQNFSTIRIRDVANVTIGSAIRTGAALVDGHESLLGTVMMLTGANSRNVARAVHQRIAEISASGDLPSNVKIKTLYNRSDLVDATLKTVMHNLLVGAGLVIVILFLLLGNLKAAFVVSASIPATLLATFGFMKIFSISGNLMSLGSLDFGIIVDGAVIVVDHCVRWMQDKERQGSVIDKIKGASQEIRSAAGFGQIMVIVVFLPILGLGGTEGKMFRPMAQTFSIALLVALVFSFTLVPALTAILFSNNESDREPWLMGFLERIYVPSLELAIRLKWILFSGSLGLLVLSFVLFSRLGAEFLPRLDEGSLILQFQRAPQTSLELSIENQEKTEEALLKVQGVRSVFSRIGTPEVATDPMGPNESDTFVLLDEKNLESKPELIAKLLKASTTAVSNQEASATQPIQMRFNDLLEGTRADLTVKIYGDDFESMTQLSSRISQALKKFSPTSDVQTEFRGGIPLIELKPHLDILSRYGLSAGPVMDAVGIGMAGDSAGYFYEGLRRIPVVVRLADQTRNDLKSLEQLIVDGGSGLTIPLKEVADLGRKTIQSPILRENSKRRTAVLINPRGIDVQTFVEESRQILKNHVSVSPGTRVEWTGSFKNLEDAKFRLSILGPLALALVALMVYWAFRRWTETIIVLASVPLGLVGGVFGLYFSHNNFSISAAVGFIALMGIAVLNGMVLVHYFNQYREVHGSVSDRWIFEASKARLRAVLMTALVDILGFLPMAFSTGVGAEVQKPLAVVVIGGIISSTALTLILLPVISSVFLVHPTQEREAIELSEEHPLLT